MVDVCDVPVISSVCDVAGDAAGALVSAPFDWLAQGMGHAAGWMFEAVWKVFDSTTMVDVTSSQYTKVYNILFGVAVFVMLGFFMLQVIGGMIRREPAALSRAALGLAKSILGSFVALALLATALEITDQLCIGIVNAAGTNMEQMGDRIALLTTGLVGLNVAAPGAGAILTIFIAGLAIGAAGIVWISLLVRKALLLIAIVFAPVALAGSSWDHTRGWVSKWASFVIALIISKVVLVVIFLLATAQVSAPIDSDIQSVSEPIAGVVLMLMAGFAPYMTYKAINFMGFDMYHAMSAEQEGKSALNRPMPIPMNRAPSSQPSKVLDGGSSGGGSVAVHPHRPPHRPGRDRRPEALERHPREAAVLPRVARLLAESLRVWSWRRKPPRLESGPARRSVAPPPNRPTPPRRPRSRPRAHRCRPTSRTRSPPSPTARRAER